VADVLCGAPGVTEANVYGVEVPGEDGRAGMAALVLAGGARFDGAALHARAERHLPAYARPAFVRLVSEMDVTGTLKQRKLALAAEGYDPARVTDPLFVRADRRMREQRRLDLGRRDVDARGLDHVLQASAEVERPALVELPEVAGVEEALGVEALRR